MSARAVEVVLGLAAAVFGLACLNYTGAPGADHHAEWAAEHGLPAPSQPLLFLGAGSCLVGGLLLGRASRRPAR
jgi:hypothetical protein